MPITAKDFTLYNSNPTFEAQVNRAFDYFRAKLPNADSMLQALIDKGVAIMYNPPGNPQLGKYDGGEDLFGTYKGHPVALWNPAQASLVTNCSLVVGIQSAADGLAHELFGHGLNPNNDAQGKIPDAKYEWYHERVAGTIESVLNAALNEPVRDSHAADAMAVDDVTLHTVMGENGELTLVRMGADGNDEYGPQITYDAKQNLQGLFYTTFNNRTASGGDGTIDDIHVTGHRSGDGATVDLGTITDVVNVTLEPGPELSRGNPGSADVDITAILTGDAGGTISIPGNPDNGTGDIDSGLDGVGVVFGNGFNHFDHDTGFDGLTSNADWLQHWGHLLGHGPVPGGVVSPMPMPAPAPMPAPMPGLDIHEVTLVSVNHIVDGVFA